jgi:ABC-type antimicrobial peptide transport system permease subunit
MTSKINVPKIPHAFFKWYCEPQRYEELHGDLEEFYYERVATQGPFKAKLHYTLDVIRCCQPYAWRPGQERRSSNLDMFGNYFKVAVRGMMKNQANSVINIFGLSIAIGICILVYGYMQWDHDIDRFHKNGDAVHLVTYFGDQDGTIQQYGTTPRPLGEMLRNDLGRDNKVCRVEDGAVIVKYQDNTFYEQVRYVDPNFLEMFTFPLKWGAASSLSDLNSIILSEDISIKYFGDENPIGRDLLIKFRENESKTFKVTGVAEEFPKAHDIDFNFLINYENILNAYPAYKADDWSKFVSATFVQLNDPSALPSMEKYRKLQNEAQHDRAITEFAFEPLTTLHERAGKIKNAISHDGNLEGRIGMPIVALFMLALACFNYINIAIVSATRRLKEIGVRKVIGANRLRMVVQFLSENMVTTLFALVLGFILAITIFIPWFVRFSGGDMQFDVFDKNLILFLVGLLAFTGIASGLYPALYISQFDAVKIFKGSVSFGRKNPLTKIFLGIQIVLACVLITTGVVFTQNNDYQSNLSWGYDQKGALYAVTPNAESFEKLKTVMSDYTSVEKLSGSADHLGKQITNAIIHLPSSKQYEVDQLSVDAMYFETMGLQLFEGRSFEDRSERDKQTIVINELLAKNLELQTPVGTIIIIDTLKYEVVGVVKDFHTKNFFHEIRPTLFRLADESDLSYLTMRVTPGSEQETYGYLQAQWQKLFPEVPFDGGFQEDVWGIYFHRVDRSEQFNKVVATIAVLLASMGLYGLVTINVSGRSKEFSIRKVLGASVRNIATVIINQYVVLIAIALLIGIPASYAFTQAYLHMLFSYPMPMGYSGIMIAVVILIAIILGVVSTQINKVKKDSLVDGLKTE